MTAPSIPSIPDKLIYFRKAELSVVDGRLSLTLWANRKFTRNGWVLAQLVDAEPRLPLQAMCQEKGACMLWLVGTEHVFPVGATDLEQFHNALPITLLTQTERIDAIWARNPS